MLKTNSDLAQTIDKIETQLASQSRAVQAIKTVLARGTRDVTDTAEVAVTNARLTDRVEAALRAHPLALEELVAETKAAAGKVASVLRALRSEHKICNLGTEDSPVWFWRVGDKAQAPEIIRAVEQALRIRPMALRELGQSLGVSNRNRLSSAMVYLQIRARNGELKGSVLNVGNERVARWFVAPPSVGKGPTSRGGARSSR